MAPAPVSFDLDTKKLTDGKHVLRIVSKDPRGKEGIKYIPFIGKIPIAMFHGSMDTSPAKVFSNFRSALQVLSVKSKADRLNSLCIIHTKNKDFHFFHSTNNFIFIELAEFGVAFFYFYKQKFEDYSVAVQSAMGIVQENYAGAGA